MFLLWYIDELMQCHQAKYPPQLLHVCHHQLVSHWHLINQIYIDFSAGNLSRLIVERDNFRVFDRIDTLNERIQTDGIRVPQASQFVYDPTEDGNGAESLVTAGVNDLRFTLVHSAAATDTISVVYIGGLDA